MTSARASHLMRRYVDVRRQLTNLDAQHDYLATLDRQSLERFDGASDRDRRAAGLEHDALHRAVTLFLDEHEHPTRSRLQAKMQAIAAELTENEPDPVKVARRLAGLRDPLSPPPSLADTKARLKAILSRSRDGERRLRRMLAAPLEELDPSLGQESPPACPADGPDLAAVPPPLMVPGEASAPAEPSLQPMSGDGPGPSFEKLDKRLDAITTGQSHASLRASRWLKLRRLLRLA